MIWPDLLAGCRRKTNAIVDRTRVPRFANAEANHIADAHVHYHLRRRHDHHAHIGERIDTGIGQPVIEPHRMGAGRKGVGEGVAARRFLADQPLEPMTIANALRLQVT